MAKWVCVKEGYNLTVNKVYDGYIIYIGEYTWLCLINDIDYEYTYNKSKFMPLDEWREQQIKSVLDD